MIKHTKNKLQILNFKLCIYKKRFWVILNEFYPKLSNKKAKKNYSYI